MGLDLDIRYARNGGVSIAYAVAGEAELDLVVVPGFISHLEMALELPSFALFFERLMSFARVIAFDKRGTGLSDRGVGVAPLEEYVSDVEAVMDAAGSEKSGLLGVSEGGSIAALFAATRPERTAALVIYGGWGRVAWAADYTLGVPPEALDASADYLVERWGTGVGLRAWAPSVGDDPVTRQWWAQLQRLAASPGDVRSILSLYREIDVRHALPSISAPTLVIHRKDDRMVPVEGGRYLSEHIPGAKHVELPGSDHFIWTEDAESVLGEIEEFLTGVRHAPQPTRRLATVLFTDIVGSTETASTLGDTEWRKLLERHDEMVRRALARFGGREIKSTGDGFLAVFEGPTAAIRCADAIRGGASGLGCEIRAGVHTGEIEIIGEDIGGIAVNIARRVADRAGPGEIWVSGTVPGVAVGSGIRFEDRGETELKGVPNPWPLFSVATV